MKFISMYTMLKAAIPDPTLPVILLIELNIPPNVLESNDPAPFTIPIPPSKGPLANLYKDSLNKGSI